METIGNIKGNLISLGHTDNGLCYKNYARFADKSNEVCYVPEHGLPEDNEMFNEALLDDPELITYNYWDFIQIAKDYTKINDVNNVRVLEVAQAIFTLCDWQTPDAFIFAEIDE